MSRCVAVAPVPRRRKVAVALAAAALMAGGVAGLLPARPVARIAAQTAECPLVSQAEIEEIFGRSALRVGVESRAEAEADSSAVAEQTQCEFQFVEDNPLEGSATATLTKGAFNLSGGRRYGAIFDPNSGAQPVEGLGDQAVLRIIRLEGLPPVIGQLDVRIGDDMLSTTVRLPATEIDDDGVRAALRTVIEKMMARLDTGTEPAAAPAPEDAALPADDAGDE